MVVGEFTESVDLLVIGGGPGGYVAALRAAQLGRQVTLVERAQLGGVCLNVGCIPSKALIAVANEWWRTQHAAQRGILVDAARLDVQGVQQFKDRVVDHLTGGVAQLLKAQHITVVSGEARFTSPHQVRVVSEYESQKLEFRHAIIATGSRPRDLPGFGVDTDGVVMGSTELLALDHIPPQLVVVGGGYIGLELGTAYAKFGSQVTIVETTDRLLAGIEPALVRVVTRRLRELGIEVMLKTRVTSLNRSSAGAELALEGPNGSQRVSADAVVVTVGRIPNTDGLDLAECGVTVGSDGLIVTDERLRTTNTDIAAIGDVASGPMLAHKASYQGKIAAESLSGLTSVEDARAIPAVIFTDPEVASVGLTEEEAQLQGYDPIAARFPFQANGRALSLDDAVGQAIVVADGASGQILGWHVVGPEASTLIAEGTLAIEMGAVLEDVALTIHAHPTLSEVLAEAAEAALGRPIHITARSTPS